MDWSILLLVAAGFCFNQAMWDLLNHWLDD